jgi:RNA polymerase sigma-70 factor (ECF subfamily)
MNLPHSLGDPAAAGDEELARRAATGEAAAFECIIRRHNRLMFRTVRSILRSDAESEEVVQEAYLKAWRSLPGFRGEAKLSTWLVRIAMNEAFSRVRRTSAEIVPLAAGGGPHLQDATMAHDPADPADPADGPERTALRQQMRRLVEAHIDALPAQFRIVFVLRAVEELDVDEVAQLLRVPPATVRTRFFRARSVLREALARDVDFAIEDAFGFAGEQCDRIVRAVAAAIAADPASTTRS